MVIQREFFDKVSFEKKSADDKKKPKKEELPGMQRVSKKNKNNITCVMAINPYSAKKYASEIVICWQFIRLAKNSSGKRNHKQLSNVPPSTVSWRY